jgi:hypothetical protein
LGVLCAWFFLESNALQFFVAGRALPLFVTTMTLAAQAIDTSSLLGNVDSSYRSGFWNGYVGKTANTEHKNRPTQLLSQLTPSFSSIQQQYPQHQQSRHPHWLGLLALSQRHLSRPSRT